jgi:hypothetical protein
MCRCRHKIGYKVEPILGMGKRLYAEAQVTAPGR